VATTAPPAHQLRRLLFIRSGLLAGLLCWATEAGARWVFEFVDDTRDYSEERCDRTLRLDAAGGPHIVAGNWYIRHDGVTWQFELIAPVCRHPSLAVDGDGNAHISYCDGSRLQYTVRGSRGSRTETVDADSMSGWYSSIAFDGEGRPHISYQLHDPADMQLRHAMRDSSGWHISIVDTAGAAGFCSSIAMDVYGYPHISYYGDTDLRYACKDGIGWHIETADACSWLGKPTTSLAVDRWRRPHISYFGGRYAELRYASKQGPVWVTELLDDSGKIGMWSSLALDTGGHVHVVHYDGTHTDLKYGCRYGTLWMGERADTAGDVGLYASLATDAQQCPHVVYYDLANAALKYAVRDEPFLGAEDPGGRLPVRGGLLHLHPNPASTHVLVYYSVGRDPPTGAERVFLEVYDPAGRLVRTLEEHSVPWRAHSALWDLRLPSGGPAPPGTYILRLRMTDHGVCDAKKLTVTR
jgi:hypothetical protein